jgi:flagellar biosynthesis/type III secretory pathway chaperone
MKKKDIINLIKYHMEGNDAGFKSTAYQIAKDFDAAGDTQLGLYLMSLMSDANTFVPQQVNERLDINGIARYFEKVPVANNMLLLPDTIMNDVLGIVNAINHNIGMHCFLFEGAPGTGKTEAVKQLGRILTRDVYMINFSEIIDSRLGQTAKNIISLFDEMNHIYLKHKTIFLFDEIDALALDRTNENDLREMGRATSTLLKGLDSLDKDVVVIATTNLFSHLDKALVRRFDAVINFNRYTSKDLLDIAEKMLNQYLDQMHIKNRDIRLFRKIFTLTEKIPYPGDLKNMIRTAVAFSNPHDGMDYFRRLYAAVCGHNPDNMELLKKQKFTVREIGILTNKSKSTVDRELKGGSFNE